MTDLADQIPAEWDEKIASFVIKRNDMWIVSVTPMIFNDRICLTGVDEYPYGYSAGWCYDKGGAAFLAAAAWDIEKQFKPMGYKKEAFDLRSKT